MNSIKFNIDEKYKNVDSYHQKLNYSYVMSDAQNKTKSLKKYLLPNMVDNCANEIIAMLYDENMDEELASSAELESAVEEFLAKKVFNSDIKSNNTYKH